MSSTPKHIQKYYDAFVSNDIKGPMLWHEIINEVEIEEMAENLSPEEQLRNYNQKDVSIEDNNVLDGF